MISWRVGECVDRSGKAWEAMCRIRDLVDSFESFDDFYDHFYKNIVADIGEAKLAKWLLHCLYIVFLMERRDAELERHIELLSEREQNKLMDMLRRTIKGRTKAPETPQDVRTKARTQYVENMERHS